MKTIPAFSIQNIKIVNNSTTTRTKIEEKNLETINAGEGVEEREHSCTVGGNVNWYSHYGEQYGGSLKNYK